MANYDRDPYGLLQIRSSLIDAQRENTARQAKTTVTWTTTGVGAVKVEKVFAFPVTFLYEPIVSTGYALDEDDDLVDGSYPRAFAGVYDWKYDSRGYYTGAWVFFVVDTFGKQVNYKINHHLVFQGLALKDLPAHLLEK